MKLRTILLGLLSIPALHAAAIDLSPRWVETTIDGFTRRQLFFAEGDKKFLISTDRETEVAPGFGGTAFKFPKFPNIEFYLTPSGLSPSDLFKDVKLTDYREAARKLLPARAHKAEVVEETSNPIIINEWTSFRVLYRFAMDARPYRQGVTFLNLNDHDQIVIVTTAPEQDWSEAEARSWQIVRSWQEMLPGDEGRQKGN